ncbi:EF-hand domain-containing protein [Nitratireductor indicus]|uniref:Acid-shock protein n=1 Tax=Nitratireductor indicus C115 TaxID=1231190 RepID=K2PSL4_9HYPH|nr:EF-hand domain-containing protein [Nitratireductor indicus]EKF44062.1 acid-shock protein [Nitratireductor indicus C115]MDS1135651.1 EF-hand domain-containing protein [Nitratireductor indicus]SFQ11027.1 Ca2+-binding protein, EF-hand superfamily [Nitratireductor indicus]
MKTKILLSALAATLIAGSAAVAQNGPGNATPPAAAEQGGPMKGPMGGQMNGQMNGKGGGRMAHLDSDGDGAISLEEFSSMRLEQLKAADKDGDGVLSEAELQDHVQQRELERKARHAARRLDVDGDGKVTIAEIEGLQKKRFALMDANNDGKIEQDEMRRGFRMMADARGGRDGHGMRGEGREMHQKGGRWGGDWRGGKHGGGQGRGMNQAAPDAETGTSNQ